MSQSKPKVDLKSDPLRKDYVVEHRTVRQQIYQASMNIPKSHQAICISWKPKSKSCLPPLDTGYPDILLKDMDKSTDRVYFRKSLILTIIDDPMLGLSAVNLVVEDLNKDVTRLSIYGLPHNQSTCEQLAFGTVIGIFDPYLRIAPDGKFGIRVENKENIGIILRKKDMCRYCGEENAGKKCADCKRTYCSRECQMEDWKRLKHKLVCKTPVVYSINCLNITASFKK